MDDIVYEGASRIMLYKSSEIADRDGPSTVPRSEHRVSISGPGPRFYPKSLECGARGTAQPASRILGVEASSSFFAVNGRRKNGLKTVSIGGG